MRRRHSRSHLAVKTTHTEAGTSGLTQRKRADLSVVSLTILVLANLVPLVGVVFLEWDVFSIVIVFWCENVIIGLFSILELMLASEPSRSSHARKAFLVPFFTFHYGMFCLAHGVFVFVLFGSAAQKDNPVFAVAGVLWGVIGYAVDRGTAFLKGYIERRRHLQPGFRAFAVPPYERIIILHVTIIGGGCLVQWIGSPVPALVLLIVLKTGLDIYQRMAESHGKGRVGMRIPKMIKN